MIDTTRTAGGESRQSTARDDQATRLVAASIRAELHGDASRAGRLAISLKDRQRPEQERSR